jgi:SAM-dependent methyltransferase
MTTACLICGSPDVLLLEERERVPIGQNLVFSAREAALHCPAGRLDMRRCTACGFVWNAAFDAALMVYDAAYDNSQTFSPRFVAHVDEVADRIAERVRGGRRVDLVEVGCGQGEFIGVLARRFGPRLASAIGYDPAWRGDPRNLPAGASVRGEYFGKDAIRADDPRPDVVVSRHTIEHVPDPLAFLRAIRAAMAEGTPLFVETPDIDWVLERGVFFDFYYEHCSLFALPTLAFALERAGFVVEDVRPMLDGQYQLAQAVAGPLPGGATRPPASGWDDCGYRNKRDAFLAGLTRGIDALGPPGTVALWGGASKGVTLCLTIPAAARRIAATIDINTRKQGGFLPASGIPIVSAAEAAARGVRHAVVVNPVYLDEIRASLATDGLPIEAVSIDTLV